MARFLKKKSNSIGHAPGSPIFIGTKKVDECRIRVIDYDNSSLQEMDLENISDGKKFKTTPTVTWINVNGLHDTELMKEISLTFDLHPLTL